MNDMWSFLESAEAEPELLEEAVKSLVGLAKAKNFHHEQQGLLEALPIIKWQIIVEASRLVLDPRWRQIKEIMKKEDTQK